MNTLVTLAFCNFFRWNVLFVFLLNPRLIKDSPCQQLTYSLTDSCLVDLTWMICRWLIRMTAECLLIAIILNLNFVPDFDPKVWSRFWCWVFIKLLGEALTLVRTLSPLVHCAFAMFLFGSLVSLAMLLFFGGCTLNKQMKARFHHCWVALLGASPFSGTILN